MSQTPIPIFDGHNDTLLRLYRAEADGPSFFEQSDVGHIDLPRARAGGLGGGFFAIFVPNEKLEVPMARADSTDPAARSGKSKTTPPVGADGKASYAIPLPQPLEHAYASNYVMGMAARLFKLAAESDGAVKVVRTADELTTALDDGTLAVIMHFEGAEAIDTDLNALYVFYEAGLRSLGPVWSRANAFATGVPFNFPAGPDIGPGLTDAGKRLLKACNQLGVMFDLSHLNEAGFWDVAKRSDAPLVATHSNVHALTPSPRNLTDKQLDAVAESGGVVGVNFHVGFLRTDGRLDQETSLDEIVRHAGYMADRIGIEHVALGSDFDGATMPGDLKDVAGLPKLVAALRAAGFDDDALAQIAHQNWVRVLRATWKQ